MQRKITLNLLFVFLTASLLAQSPIQKLYNTGGDDYANQAANMINNGVGLVGSTSKAGAGGYDAMIEIFDTAGVLQSETQYGGPGTEYGTSITSTFDGFALTGRTNSFSSNGSMDIPLIKTDWTGAMQWVKAYHSDSAEYALWISRTIDSGYIITGQTSAFSSGGTDLFLIKTDASGHIQWSKTYGGAGDEEGLFTLQTPNDSGFLALGYSGSGGAGGLDAYAVKTDKNGTVQAQFLLGGSGDEQFKSFTTNHQGLIFAGTTGSTGQDKLFLACLDQSTLQLKWAKTYGGSNVDELTSITTDIDGNVVVAGYTSSFGNSNGADGLYFKVDSNGNPLWAYAMGTNGFTDIQQVVGLQNGSFGLVGFTDSFGISATGNSDVYLGRTQIGGALCNNARTVSLTVGAWVPTITLPFTGATSQTASFTETTPAFVQNSYTPNTVDLCAQQILSANAGNNKVICQGGNGIPIGGQPTGTGGNGLTYAWSPSAGLSSTSAANPIANPTGTTTYTVTVTDNTSATISAQVTVSVDTVPAIAFTVQPTIGNCQVIVLTATPAGGVFGGPGVTDSLFSAANASLGPDTLTYTFTDAAQCSASQSAIINVAICEGINELSGSTISIAPNPSNGVFDLSLGNITITNAAIRVFDLTGRMIYSGKADASGKTRISLVGQPAGTYLLEFDGAGQTLHHTLVIE